MRPVVLAMLLAVGGPLHAQEPMSGPLVVYNAGSLARPFKDLLDAFVAVHHEVIPAQENSGSLEAARKLTELGKIPDVIGVADYEVIPKLLIPKFASWFVMFAKNSMVIIYTEQSTGAAEVNSQNWWRILLRPDVRTGHSNPALDPNGYRTLMIFQLAEKLYREPGLAERLNQAIPPRYIRPKEADLTALVQAGELDYSFSYASIAKSTGLRYVDLPPEIDLSDPNLADWYKQAVVKVPGQDRSGRDSVEFRGEPIVYALTIPTEAAHPALAEAFVRFALSAEAQAILQKDGFVVIPRPLFGGLRKPPASLVSIP